MIRRDLFVVVCIYFHSVVCDVSHLHNILYNVDPFYGFHPVFVSSTVKPSIVLPEILVNSANGAGGGYHYDKPDNTYLPAYEPPLPPQADPPSNGYLPPQQPSIPLADPPFVLPPSPPTSGYLPPDHVVENFEGIHPQNDPININGHDPGYHYDPPTTTTPPAPVFIPQADPPVNGGYVYEPPRNPSPGYLPSVTERSAKGYEATNGNGNIQLQLNEMRCIPNQGGYFKSILTLQSPIYASPVVDNEIIDSRCDIRLVRSQVVVNIAAEDFQRCGVAYCGANLCLRIRFPLIRGMKTGGDSILTLQCKIQERIISKTHAFKLGISNEAQSRSLGAIAQGGSQLPFRTSLELLRKTANGFTKYLEPNGIVQLGEELQLRAHARAGDGWNFTRLADVNLQRVSSSGEIINSAALVNPSGCVNPSMRSISPIPPTFEPPLGHRLTFKAVMFQGMRNGDELLMSVKIVGCMDQRDCYVNTLNCDRNALTSQARIRRDTKGRNITELSEVSTISFRVESPEAQPVSSSRLRFNMAYIVVGGILTSIGLFSLLAIIVYLKFTRKY